MLDVLPPVPAGASARWRCTSTSWFITGPGPSTYGESEHKTGQRKRTTALSPPDSADPMIALEQDGFPELSTLGMRGLGLCTST